MFVTMIHTLSFAVKKRMIYFLSRCHLKTCSIYTITQSPISANEKSSSDSNQLAVGKTLIEFVCLRTNFYNIYNQGGHEQRAKGVQRSAEKPLQGIIQVQFVR